MGAGSLFSQGAQGRRCWCSGEGFGHWKVGAAPSAGDHIEDHLGTPPLISLAVVGHLPVCLCPVLVKQRS